VQALERASDRLHDLVDGHAEWSHRTRLHKLETDAASAKLATQALHAYRTERGRGWREWGGFTLAAVAVAVSVGHAVGVW
jgi:hypothetical protein